MEELREESATSGNGGELTKRERRTLRHIAEYLEFADLLALLMVTATAFTGYATWRTATIANALFLASERPYIGVRSVTLDASRPNEPIIEIRYANFGHVSAEGARLTRRLTIDGKIVNSETRIKNAGILSPEVPHSVDLHVPDASYGAVVSGKAVLKVEFAATYTGPGRGELCYLERFVYVAEEKQFEVDGGSTHCADQQALTAAGVINDSN